MKSKGITKVIRVHPKGGISEQNAQNGNPSNRPMSGDCQRLGYISVNQNVAGEEKTSTTARGAK